MADPFADLYKKEEPEEAPEAIVSEAESNPFADLEPQSNSAGDTSAGISAGWESTKEMGNLALAAIQHMAGFDEAAEKNVVASEENASKALRLSKGHITRIEDAENFGDYVDYAQYGLGTLAPMAAESMIGAGIGSLLGSSAAPGPGTAGGAIVGVIAKGTIKSLVKDYLKKELNGVAKDKVKAIAKKEVADFFAGNIKDKAKKQTIEKAIKNTALKYGALSGASATSYQMGLGDVYGNTIDAGDASPWIAAGAAVPYAAADMLAEKLGIGRLFKEGIGNFVARGIKGGIVQAPAEGLSELSQEEINIRIREALDNSEDPYSDENNSVRLNALVLGSIGGGAIGSITGTLQKVANADDNEIIGGKRKQAIIETLKNPNATKEEMQTAADKVYEFAAVDDKDAADQWMKYAYERIASGKTVLMQPNELKAAIQILLKPNADAGLQTAPVELDQAGSSILAQAMAEAKARHDQNTPEAKRQAIIDAETTGIDVDQAPKQHDVGVFPKTKFIPAQDAAAKERQALIDQLFKEEQAGQLKKHDTGAFPETGFIPPKNPILQSAAAEKQQAAPPKERKIEKPRPIDAKTASVNPFADLETAEPLIGPGKADVRAMFRKAKKNRTKNPDEDIFVPVDRAYPDEETIADNPELKKPGVLEEMETLAKGAGWQERGGKVMMDEDGNVLGRTKWLPKEAWFADKPEGVTEKHFTQAIERLKSGRKLTKPQKAAAAFMLDVVHANQEGQLDDLTPAAEPQGGETFAKGAVDLADQLDKIKPGAGEAILERAAMSDLSDTKTEELLRSEIEKQSPKKAEARSEPQTEPNQKSPVDLAGPVNPAKQAAADLERQKDEKRNAKTKEEPALAQSANDLFADGGRLEPDLFDQKSKPRQEKRPRENKDLGLAGKDKAAANQKKHINEQAYYDAVSKGIFRDSVSNAIQNDGQRLLDAVDNQDISALDILIKKYAKDAGKDQGGIGAGPGKLKQARRGAAQLWGLAVKAKKELIRTGQQKTTKALSEIKLTTKATVKETGETVEITESADALLRESSKRVKSLKALLKCVAA